MSVSEEASRLRARLIAETGAYLRNVIRQPNVTCQVCTAPIKSRFVTCQRCARDRQQEPGNLADLVLPVFYAVNGQQSAHLMRMYKYQVAPDQRGRILLTKLLWATLHFHGNCVMSRLGRRFDMFCTVPSTSGRSGEHPLRVVARGVLSHYPEVRLVTQSVSTSDPRALDPRRFALIGPASVRGRHVLVLDDIWTTGGRIQSAALMLKNAGAATVTALTLGRWINPDEEPSRSFVRDRLHQDYDPLTCPLGASMCHPT